MNGTGTYAGVFGNTTVGDGAGVSGVAMTDGGYGVVGSSQGATGTGVSGTCSKGLRRVRRDRASVQRRTPGGTGRRLWPGDGRRRAGRSVRGRPSCVAAGAPTSAGAPTTGAHDPGELIVDGNGVLFSCRSAGTQRTWIRVNAPPAIPTTLNAPVLNILPTPERFVDTRTGLGGVQGTQPAETTRTFAMTGRLGEAADPTLQIPVSATTLVGNLTAIGAGGIPLGSFATLWPGGPLPKVSNINFGARSLTGAIANSFVEGLTVVSGHGSVNVYNHAPCDYILDVTGYYTTS